jgi:hypothetical protein
MLVWPSLRSSFSLLFEKEISSLSLAKMSRLNSLLFLALVLCSPALSAQEADRILLMNGKYLEVYSFNDTSYTFLEYTYDKKFYKKERLNMREAWKEGKTYHNDFEGSRAQEIPQIMVKGRMDREDVFSFIPANGEERVYYFYDEPKGNYFEVEEMRAFVYGERDARNNVRGRGWFYGGLVLGTLTGYAFENSVIALAVPPVFALGTKIPVIRVKDDHIADKSYRGNDIYASGYESYSRSRNAIQALKGSAIGTALGIIAFSIVDNNR